MKCVNDPARGETLKRKERKEAAGALCVLSRLYRHPDKKTVLLLVFLVLFLLLFFFLFAFTLIAHGFLLC